MIVLFWCLCGFAAAYIASEKRRSVFNWLVAGFLFGPIGLLMIAAIPARTRRAAAQARGDMRSFRLYRD